ncbi:glycosyltransferase family 2 protein, partial [Dyadobacter alkalitolerans]|uniref:glycosyltransferase family 2 protein n=1 Tax=Dyadobacter alkalitolerans TaxID=492736 RepID=UPI0005543729
MVKRISIITINLNNVKGLRQTIESVVPQLNDAIEFIIIDGNSTDGSLEVIKEYESKITLWKSEEKQGIYTDMNKGIASANGEYCLFLNSGDWLNTNIISEAIEACTGEGIIYFNNYLSYSNASFEQIIYPPTLTMRSFYKQTIGHQATLIRRELFYKFGMYNEGNAIYSDYEFWLKSIIMENATCKHVNKFLSFYDMGGQSSKPDENAVKEINSILNRNFPKRVLDDYEYWYNREREMEILVWYKNQKLLYRLLVFIYKITKNLTRLVHGRSK